MPKGDKRRKNKKNVPVVDDIKPMVFADDEGQVYGSVTRILGSRFFCIKCSDGKERRCKVRSKRMRIVLGDTVIVSLRDYQDEVGDIIHKFLEHDVKKLKKMGILPDTDLGNIGKNLASDDENDGGFDFEEI